MKHTIKVCSFLTGAGWIIGEGQTFANAPIPTKTPLNESEVISNSSTSMAGLFFQTVLALALIIGLIYILFRFFGKRTNLLFGKTAIRSLGGCSVGPQKSVQIIQVGSSLYLVGVGEDINLLRHISGEEAEEIIFLLESQGQSVTSSVMGIQALLNRMSKKQANKEQSGFETLFQSKVEEAKQRRQRAERELFNDEENE